MSRKLTVETLDDRIVPSVTFDFDYSTDTTGFFNDPARRATLEQVGRDIGSRLDADLGAITVGNGNAFTIRMFDPVTGQDVNVPGSSIAANHIRIYVGSRELGGSTAATGGGAGYRISGSSPEFFESVRNRNAGGVDVFAGTLSLDSTTNFYFGDPAGLTTSRGTDFYTVVSHELGHVLGVGTSAEFDALVGADGFFTGANAVAQHGGPVPITGDHAHVAQGADDPDGDPISLRPTLNGGRRYGLSGVDLGILADLGLGVTNFSPTYPESISGGGDTSPILTEPNPVPPVVVPPVVPPVVVPPSIPPVVVPPSIVPPSVPPVVVPPGTPDVMAGTVAVTGSGGTVQLFDLSGGSATAVGSSLTPFAGFTGTVRATTADVNGDGTLDIVTAVGAGGGSLVRVYDGKTGADLVPATNVFEGSFTGGLYLAAADVDGDGRAEVIVSPDQGGGGRVTVLKVGPFGATVAANFFGIDDPNFRGGARVAAADINADGRADLVVGAGFGGGPRVAVFDGSTVLGGGPRKLVNDFFAFGGEDATRLRNGVFLSAGDLNGDGRAELAFGGGPGGGPRVLVLDGSAVLANPAAAAANPVSNFFAGSTADRGGVRLTITDVDQDGVKDLVAGGGRAVTVFSHGDPTRGSGFDPLAGRSALDGVFVG